MHIGKQGTQLHNVVKYPLSQPLYVILEEEETIKMLCPDDLIRQANLVLGQYSDIDKYLVFVKHLQAILGWDDTCRLYVVLT